MRLCSPFTRGVGSKKATHPSMRIIHALFALSLFALASCASTPRSAEWVPFEKVHPAVSELLNLKSGDSIEGCGNIVTSGRRMYTLEGGGSRVWEPELEDDASEYFNNRTGKRVDTCEFVKATRESNEKENCPPREWKCAWN
jgi:hypothetical protein